MKLHLVSPDSQGRIDCSVRDMLLSHLELTNESECDYLAIPVTFFPDFSFVPPPKKPYILFDFLEYGAHWNHPDTHLLGVNPEIADNLQSEEWKKFSDWVKENPPVLYFKRELKKKDRTSHVQPIEFPCVLDAHVTDSEEAFNARPIEVFHSWGYSHPSRIQLHADIFTGMAKDGLGIISDFRHFHPYMDHGRQEHTWATIFCPYYARESMANCQWFMDRSKLVTSLWGAGQKCFRMGEASVHSIMVLPEDDLAWAYDWQHGVNCIRLREGHHYEDLKAATKRDDLYQIYLNGLETIDRYRVARYVREYIIPTIHNAL